MLDPTTGELKLYSGLMLAPWVSRQHLLEQEASLSYSWGTWGRDASVYMLRSVECMNGSVRASLSLIGDKLLSIDVAVTSMLGASAITLSLEKQAQFLIATLGLRKWEMHLNEGYRIDFSWGNLRLSKDNRSGISSIRVTYDCAGS